MSYIIPNILAINVNALNNPNKRQIFSDWKRNSKYVLYTEDIL